MNSIQAKVCADSKCDVVNLVLQELSEKGEINLEDKGFLKEIGPQQPDLPGLTKSYKQTNRAFSTSWYKKYIWLTGSTTKNKLFCWKCLLFGQTFKSPWNSTGFDNLKSLYMALEKHNDSKDHIFCQLKYKLFKI